MHGNPAGTPGFMCSQPSSLPTNSTLAPECSRICAIVVGASVGYSGTETAPASQIAKSLIIQCAVFFEMMATRSPGCTPRLCRCVAMRRAWSQTSRQV